MRFAAGVVVGTLFGRTALRMTTRVIPKSVRDKVFDKTVEKASAFTVRRIESAMSYGERKMWEWSGEERPTDDKYRRYRR